jgi:hypothetical protein
MSASDSLLANKGCPPADCNRNDIAGKTTTAYSKLTSTPGTISTGTEGSFGATSPPVSALALSGRANSKIFLSQADSAVAAAVAEQHSRLETLMDHNLPQTSGGDDAVDVDEEKYFGDNTTANNGVLVDVDPDADAAGLK